MNPSDLTGARYGKLTAVSRVASTSAGRAMWSCVCDCGVTRPVLATNLKSGKTKSCGCLGPSLRAEARALEPEQTQPRTRANARAGAITPKPSIQIETYGGPARRGLRDHPHEWGGYAVAYRIDPDTGTRMNVVLASIPPGYRDKAPGAKANPLATRTMVELAKTGIVPMRGADQSWDRWLADNGVGVFPRSTFHDPMTAMDAYLAVLEEAEKP